MEKCLQLAELHNASNLFRIWFHVWRLVFELQFHDYMHDQLMFKRLKLQSWLNYTLPFLLGDKDGLLTLVLE